MSSLTGNLISDSYLGLLKTIDNGVITSVTQSITDGAGNITPLMLSNDLVKISGSLDITGSYLSLSDGVVMGHTTITTANITVEDHESQIGFYADLYGTELYSGSNFLDITVAGNAFGYDRDGGLIAVSDDQGGAVAVIGFENHDNWVDGTVSILTPLQAQAGAQITGSLKVTGSVAVLGGISGNLTGNLTGTATNATNLNNTASAVFATTGSNTLTSTQVVSGSLRMFESASFILPTHQPTSPVKGAAYFSEGFLYIYNGVAFVSASLS